MSRPVVICLSSFFFSFLFSFVFISDVFFVPFDNFFLSPKLFFLSRVSLFILSRMLFILSRFCFFLSQVQFFYFVPTTNCLFCPVSVFFCPVAFFFVLAPPRGSKILSEVDGSSCCRRHRSLHRLRGASPTVPGGREGSPRAGPRVGSKEGRCPEHGMN